LCPTVTPHLSSKPERSPGSAFGDLRLFLIPSTYKYIPGIKETSVTYLAFSQLNNISFFASALLLNLTSSKSLLVRMDSPPTRVVSKPANGNDTILLNNLTVHNQLNGGSVSEEQQLPVLIRGDDRSAVRSPDPPAEIGLHRGVPAGAQCQERPTPIIYTTISDTESESVIIQPPDTSRKPSKVLGSKGYYPTPGPLYPKATNTDYRRRVVVYSSDESVVADSEADDDNHTTLEIQRLKEEIQDLEAKLKQKDLRAVQPQSDPSRYQTLYRLGYEVRPNVRGTSSDEYSSPSDSEDQDRRGNTWHIYPDTPGRKTRSFSTFTDPPVLMHDQWGGAYLHCSRRVDSLKYFLGSNPDISFVVFYDYKRIPEARVNKPEPSGDIVGNEELGRPTPCARSIYPVSKELKKALDLIFEDREEYSSICSQYRNTNELSAPYLFIYHSRKDIPKIKEKLSNPAQDQLDLFLEYVMKDFGEEYDTVDTLLQRKEILPQYLHYLIKKGDILVENRNGENTGYRAESLPVESIRSTPNPSIATKYGMPGNEYESPHKSGAYKWTLNGFTWGFDGKFFGRWRHLKLKMSEDGCSSSNEARLEEAAGDETEIAQLKGRPITSLPVFPLRYAPDDIQEMLYHRGDVLWKCRVPQLVSYQVDERDPFGSVVSS
jgi:hypothetical protein